jgi:hypothetical protein
VSSRAARRPCSLSMQGRVSRPLWGAFRRTTSVVSGVLACSWLAGSLAPGAGPRRTRREGTKGAAERGHPWSLPMQRCWVPLSDGVLACFLSIVPRCIPDARADVQWWMHAAIHWRDEKGTGTRTSLLEQSPRLSGAAPAVVRLAFGLVHVCSLFICCVLVCALHFSLLRLTK